MKKHIFITRRLHPAATEILQTFFDIHVWDELSPCPHDRLIEAIQTSDGLLTTVSDSITERELACVGPLSAISNFASGLNNIDTVAAKKRGIAVYSVQKIGAESTAELTIALLLSLIKQIPNAQKFVRDGQWHYWNPENFRTTELVEQTVGILGFGNVGQAVAKRMLAFGCHILFTNTTPVPTTNWSQTVRQVDLQTLYAQSDILCIHVPLNADTTQMINRHAFSQMKRRPFLINVARGQVVHTYDLVDALTHGLIRGAALDVVDPEPIEPSHPLCQIDNCIIVPHIGIATNECHARVAKQAAQNLIDHFQSL